MSKPFFSVIVPTHNGADRLPTSLQSVLKQTFDDYELIVICDSCTDNSAEVARSYGAKVLTVSCERDGLARNAGLDIATGEWILFLDDDDYYMHEYCFSKLHDRIRKEPDLDVLDFSFVWRTLGYKSPSRDECFVMVWCRAWRRSFIGSNRFNDEPYGSDKHFFNQMIKDNPDIRIAFYDSPIYYYNYLREGSLSWMEKKKTLLDIIITHYDEPWELGKPFFDMLQYQRCADLAKISVTLVQDGSENELPWTTLLSGYTFPVNVVTIPHSGVAEARNAGIENTQSDWIMFFNFDDHLADLCSLDLILKNLPTDEYNLIWGKVVQETKWYTGITYLNCIFEVGFGDTDGKMYRRQFLNEHNIRFDPRSTYYYDSIFNTLVLSECEPWKIAHMTTEIFPFLKTFRADSFRHTLEAFESRRTDVFQRDTILAEELRLRDNDFAYRRLVAKTIVYGYYTICDSDHVGKPGTFSPAYLDYYRSHKDIFQPFVGSSELDVIRAEIEAEVYNLIQFFYNEHKIEYYVQYDNITFTEWLAYLDMCADRDDQTDTELPAPQPEPTTLVTHDVRPVTDIPNPRIVVYCGTYDVYLNMIASAKSLLSTTAVDKIYFLTEDDTFPYDIPDIIENINIKPLAMQLFDPDGPNFNSAWTYMCMIRAYFPQLFPQYSRILSLDIDIVINDNVADLWNYDLSDYYYAGVPERQRQKSSSDPLYVNFGVIMMNLDKLRNDNISAQLIDSLNKQKYGCPEQDAFNKLCAGHILHLPAEYNYTTYSHITGDAVKERIVHYAGQKFWRHYSLVKKYSDREWPEVIAIQNKLQEERRVNHER